MWWHFEPWIIVTTTQFWECSALMSRITSNLQTHLRTRLSFLTASYHGWHETQSRTTSVVVPPMTTGISSTTFPSADARKGSQSHKTSIFSNPENATEQVRNPTWNRVCHICVHFEWPKCFYRINDSRRQHCWKKHQTVAFCHRPKDTYARVLARILSQVSGAML